MTGGEEGTHDTESEDDRSARRRDGVEDRKRSVEDVDLGVDEEDVEPAGASLRGSAERGAAEEDGGRTQRGHPLLNRTRRQRQLTKTRHGGRSGTHAAVVQDRVLLPGEVQSIGVSMVNPEKKRQGQSGLRAVEGDHPTSCLVQVVAGGGRTSDDGESNKEKRKEEGEHIVREGQSRGKAGGRARGRWLNERGETTHRPALVHSAVTDQEEFVKFRKVSAWSCIDPFFFSSKSLSSHPRCSAPLDLSQGFVDDDTRNLSRTPRRR